MNWFADAGKESRSKYQKGGQFKSVSELCEWILAGKPVWLWGRVNNAAFMRNQQLNTLANISKWPHCEKAVPKKAKP